MSAARLTAAIVAFSSLASAASGAKTPSKIGIHLLSSYSAGAQKIAASNLPVMKLLDLNPDMRRALVDYKTRHPRGITVLRVYTPFDKQDTSPGPDGKPKLILPYKLEQSPEDCARDYWVNRIKPQLDQATPKERKMIDYVEGPNESSDCPTWGSVEDAKWFSRFWEALAPKIAEAGYKPCIGSIAVGNPPGSHEEVVQRITAFVPALRVSKKLGGAWSYHSYTLDYTTDPKTEYWYSLRYRQYYEIFAKDFPDLKDMPLILTEGGVDKGGNRLKDGWQERGTPEKYMEWIAWFDSEIKKDPYVKGITLFAIGDDWWKSFNLEPMADKLADYLGK